VDAGTGRLSAEEREDIMIGLAPRRDDVVHRTPARAVPSTVTREVAANGGIEHYGAWRGHCRARDAAKRPKTAKLAHRPLVTPGQCLARGAVVASRDRRALALSLPRRSDDAGEPRDDLPVPLRPRTR
jgi:hypothetical protein